MKKKNNFLPPLMLGASFFVMAASTNAASIEFADFSDSSSLTLNGTASATTNASGDSVLRLVEGGVQGLAQAGTVFLNNKFDLGADGSFSTTFDFQISDSAGLGDADGNGADGLAFVLQSSASNFVGSWGGYLGYAGISPALTNSLAIEFDTFFNDPGTFPDISDPDGNHVGVNINGSVVSIATASVSPRLNGGDVFQVWIDYSGLTEILEVRLSTSDVRPADALIEYDINLINLLGTNEVFAGFTAGGAGGSGDHDILVWKISADSAFVPGPLTTWLIALGLAGIGYTRRATSNTKVNQDRRIQ